MNTAGYDSKMAALYYPWIEVMDPLTKRPDPDPAVGPHRRRVVRGPTRRAACTRRRPTRSCCGANGLGVPGHAGRAGRAQPERDQLHPRVLRAAASASGARARCRATRSGATSTSAGCSTTSPSRSSRARSGACSSPTTSGCGCSCEIAASNFLMRVWRDGALFGADARAGVLRQVRRGDQPARGHRGRPGRLRDRHRAGQAGRVRDLPPEPVHRWRR